MASAAGAETQNSYSHLLTHSLKHTHILSLHTHKAHIHTNTHKCARTHTNTHTYSRPTHIHVRANTHAHTTHTHTLTADPDRRRTDFRYTGPTISTLLFSPGPMDLDTLYVIQMCRGGYGVRSMKMWSDICSSQKMSQSQ